MQKGIAPIFIVLGIVIVLAIAGGAYYLGSNTKSTVSQINGYPTPQPTNSPITTNSASPQALAPTSNWKTLTSKNGKVSFKYPGDAQIVGDGVSQSVETISLKSSELDLNVSIDTGPVANNKDKQPTETITINGIVWNLSTSDSKSCPPGLGACEATLNYRISNKDTEVNFTFRGDYPNKTLPNSILATFRFLP